MRDITEFIRAMPKAELHLHIEGTLEPELAFTLAERNRIPLAQASAAEMRASYAFDDLTSFLVHYYEGMRVLQTADDFRDLAWAYLQRARDEHVRYAEIFFDPQAHTSRGVAFDTVIGALKAGQIKRMLDLGLRVTVNSDDPRSAHRLQPGRFRPWSAGPATRRARRPR
jgi:adenosine deaminase